MIGCYKSHDYFEPISVIVYDIGSRQHPSKNVICSLSNKFHSNDALTILTLTRKVVLNRNEAKSKHKPPNVEKIKTNVVLANPPDPYSTLNPETLLAIRYNS